MATELSDLLCLKYHNIGDIAKEGNMFIEYDEEYKCPVLDDDKVNINSHRFHLDSSII